MVWGRSEDEEGDDEHSNRRHRQCHQDGQARSARFNPLFFAFAVASEDVSRDPTAAFGAGVDEACEAIIGRDGHVNKLWVHALIAPEPNCRLWKPVLGPQVKRT